MSLQIHPLAGGSVSHLFRLISRYGCDPAFLHRVMAAGALSLSSELNRRGCDRRFAPALAATELDDAPIFILGHWRSGTTHLHHLLSQDPRFGYVSSYQALAPELFLQDLWTTRQFVQACLPKKRPMDNIELSLKKPEEEEFVLSNTSPHSFIHAFFFPRNAREIFRRSVLFEGLSTSERESWKDSLTRALKFSALSSGNSRMLLKSPANTGRIRILLEMFPKAKFLHIHRDPHTVFCSQKHTCMKLTRLWSLQTFQESDITENVLWMYEKLMGRFLSEKALIPPQNFHEISYDTLEAEPIATLKSIYERLGLSEFEQNQARFETYLRSQSAYKKNSYDLSPEIRQRVDERWAFAIRSFGYEAKPILSYADSI